MVKCKITKILLDNKKQLLEDLLFEIKEHEYNTVEQVNGHIHSYIDLVNKWIKQNEE